MILIAVVVAATIALWATGKLPEYLTSLLFLAVAAILQLAPVDVIFSGFTSAAFWLVLSGFVLGTAITKSGLAARVSAPLETHLLGSWPKLVGGVVLLSYGLAFLMPSNMGRIALLMPVVLVLADRAGLAPGSRGRMGLALAVGFGTYQLSASILPANVPNLVLSGAVESVFGLHLTYLPYLLLHAPVLGVLKGVLITACIVWLFPARPQPVADVAAATPWTPVEKRLLVLLLVTLALWMTDAVHGISPAWIGLFAACVCLMPQFGLLDGEEFARGLNIRSCLYVGGLLGLSALVATSGLGKLIGRELLQVLPLSADAPMGNMASLVALASALGFVVTSNGVPAVLVPLAQELSNGAHLPLMSVLMSQVIGYSTPWLPYQAAPIVVAMALGGVPPKQGLKLCLAVAIGTCVLLVPLDLLWFKLLGYLR